MNQETPMKKKEIKAAKETKVAKAVTSPKMPKAEKTPRVTDVASLRKLVVKLAKVTDKKLDGAICDIIDMGGFSLAVLLDTMKRLPVETQIRVARKIEDFLYFHPENGKKVVSRLKKALDETDAQCRPFLLAAIADVAEKLDDNDFEARKLGEDALAVLESNADLARKSKALEIMVKAATSSGIPVIIKLMIDSVAGLDKFQNYQFIETALLALKRLGGEELIKLLINPASDAAIRQLRVEWRSKGPDLLNDTLSILQKLDSDFAQVMLKVVDLSEFNLPFIAMVKEGVSHSDKWVRQAAVASMQKASEALNPEVLSRMLNDSATEVRLMAATSLGAFAKEQTGDILEALAKRQGESLEIRLNALYALYAQKNATALSGLVEQVDNLKIAINAQGLLALLMPRDEGLKLIMSVFLKANVDYLAEAGHYLMEMLDADDISMLISAHAEAANETHRERIIIFLRSFLEKKAGPKLDQAIIRLAEAEQKALKILAPKASPASKEKKITPL